MYNKRGSLYIFLSVAAMSNQEVETDA